MRKEKEKIFPSKGLREEEQAKNWWFLYAIEKDGRLELLLLLLLLHLLLFLNYYDTNDTLAQM